MNPGDPSSLRRLEASLAHVRGDRISLGAIVDSLGAGGWGLALGLTTGDGYAVLAGYVLTGVAVLIDAIFLWTGYQAVTALFGWLL